MSPAARGRILLVEDNRDLALGLRVNLEEQGYMVHVAHTMASGLARHRQTRPDVLILDLALPDGDGLELMRGLRDSGDETLILLLTATTQQDVKLSGLRSGADDYITKPFDLEELLARVEALLRRSRPRKGVQHEESRAEHLTLDDVEIDVRARTLRRRGETLATSRIGFDLLLALLRRRGEVVTRTELMREVWGYGEGVTSRTLDTHIFELRRLIEPDPGEPTHIKTVWRIGYRVE